MFHLPLCWGLAVHILSFFKVNFQSVHSSVGTVEYPFTLAKAKTILVWVLVGVPWRWPVGHRLNRTIKKVAFANFFLNYWNLNGLECPESFFCLNLSCLSRLYSFKKSLPLETAFESHRDPSAFLPREFVVSSDPTRSAPQTAKKLLPQRVCCELWS